MAGQSGVSAKFVRTSNAAKFLGLGESTLEKLRCFGGGPRFSKLGRVVVYALPDLESWAASRAVGSTSEADSLRKR
ncbi:MAG: DNA-binding protein [Magnetococcus sp. YQC-5]